MTASRPHPLDTFFNPSSIAIIGASRDVTKIPGLLLAFLRKNDFPGAIYPVNSNYPDIDGLRCYPTATSIGLPIDLAIVIIPARVVLGALEECAALGVKHAIVISSGFAEEGGDAVAMQEAIAALAQRTGLRISGPNAEGYYNQIAGIAATFSPTVDVRPGQRRLAATTRRIGIVAQSGGIGFAIYNRAKALGIAVSTVISTGNEADLGAGEFLDYLVNDPATDVVMLFVEGIRDVDHFLAAAKTAAGSGKPVIVTKVGRSGAGERAAASHTASMAGWTAAYDAVFARYGFIVSHDLDEAVAIAAVLTSSPRPRGDRVAVVTVSGGAGIWAADSLSAQGLLVPELSDGLQATIRGLIPSYGSPRNPIDITAQAVHSGGLQKTIELLNASDEIDSIMVVISLSSETRMPFKTAELQPVIAAQNKPIVFWSYTLPSLFARTGLAESGVVVLSGLTHASAALRRLYDRASFKLAAPAAAAPSVKDRAAPHLTSATMSEHDSKALLRATGIALPDEVLVTEISGLDAAISAVGFPLAMKIQSRDIPHKSEVGGVRVGVVSAEEAAAAFDELIASTREHRPQAALQGVLVAPMASRGVEIIVGTLLDATFGPMVMVGLGGVMTELFKDVVYRPAPVSTDEAADMLLALKGAPLLNGFRGARKADVSAAAILIAQVSQLAAQLKQDVAEIELNPVLVHAAGEGVTVVDALVVRTS